MYSDPIAAAFSLFNRTCTESAMHCRQQVTTQKMTGRRRGRRCSYSSHLKCLEYCTWHYVTFDDCDVKRGHSQHDTSRCAA